jgi:hypothetical protein
MEALGGARLQLLEIKYGSSTVLRNDGHYSPIDTVLNYRILFTGRDIRENNNLQNMLSVG